MRSLLVPLGIGGLPSQQVGFYQADSTSIGVEIGGITVATFDLSGLTVEGAVTATSFNPSGGLNSAMDMDLVKLAFRSDQVAFYTASVGSTATFTIQGQFYNNDDSNEIVGLVAAAGTGQGASIQFVAYGTIIGIRY